PAVAAGSVGRFGAVGGDVLAHPGGVPDAAAHGEVHARGLALRRGDRGADVELGIRAAEPGRVECAGQDDGLVGDARQHRGGFHHGVGAVGDQHVPGRLGGDGGAQQLAVLGGDVQAVLADDRDDGVAEGDAELVQDAADLRFADLEVGLVVEIHLVDGAAGGDDQQFVHGPSSFAGRGLYVPVPTGRAG